VKIGSCYATKNNQHPRVTGKSNGKVTYQSWGGNVGYQGGSLSRNTGSLKGFLAKVDRIIECDPKLPPLS
jgi:hypothetical protein